MTFRHAAPFIPVSEEDGILSTKGAEWFVRLLKQIESLTVAGELCQEDWGVVVFAERNGKRFWIGLSQWGETEDAWLAHLHHHSFAWVQRLTAAGNRELERVIADLHEVLSTAPDIREVAWYQENEMKTVFSRGSSTPDAS